MKKVAIAFAMLSSTLTFAQAKIYPGTYAIDVAHTKIGFNVPHMVVSTVDGRFNKFEGNINLADAFNKSTFEAKVETASIDTGIAKRDDHLRSPDFFEASKYPSMTFKATKITGSPEAFKMEGDLTIKNITKKVVLDGKYHGAINPGNGQMIAAFSATGAINRKDFGLMWNKAVEAGPVVGDTITLDIKIEAQQQTKGNKS
jgi:polyisoprenoid-binding protein YceI